MPSIWVYFSLFFASTEELTAAGITPDLFKWPQFVFCGIMLALILFFVIYFRNKCSHKAWQITMITLWTIVTVMEPIKIIWSTFIEFKGVYQWSNTPLYVCSLFMYIMPIIIWAKKDTWFRDSACIMLLSWILLGGVVNFVYPPILQWYPVLHIAGMHSLIYHSVLIFCALFTLTTKEYKLMNILDACRAMWIVGLFSIPSICFNCIFGGCDCMFFNGTTFPFTIIAEPIIKNVGLWLWIVIMYIAYLAVMCLFELPGTIIKIKAGGSLIPKKQKKTKKQNLKNKKEALECFFLCSVSWFCGCSWLLRFI